LTHPRLQCVLKDITLAPENLSEYSLTASVVTLNAKNFGKLKKGSVPG
jgi:hypothetical protein